MPETLFIRSPAGRLRDIFSKEALEKELQHHDRQAEVWLPWKKGDGRGFGFVTLQDAAKAKELVECKTITIRDVVVELHRKTATARPMPTDGLFHELETAAAEVSWSTYHTSPRLKQELQSIIDAMDDAVVRRTADVRTALRGTPEARCGLGVALFSGPPGVGKTHAMRLLASEARAKAWVISASKLVDDIDACERATKYIQHENGIWMIDEAEVLFPPRSDLLRYQSVMAKTHHRVLTHFLEVIDGLLSTAHRPGRMVVLATNLPDSMDPAFRSRIRLEVNFELPAARQCSCYWRDNARHLNVVAWLVLGCVSFAGGLSFRDMDHVAEQLVQRKACHRSAELCAYLLAISVVVRARSPSATELVNGILGALYRSSLATGNAAFAARSLTELGRGVAPMLHGLRARL